MLRAACTGSCGSPSEAATSLVEPSGMKPIFAPMRESITPLISSLSVPSPPMATMSELYFAFFWTKRMFASREGVVGYTRTE